MKLLKSLVVSSLFIAVGCAQKEKKVVGNENNSNPTEESQTNPTSFAQLAADAQQAAKDFVELSGDSLTADEQTIKTQAEALAAQDTAQLTEILADEAFPEYQNDVKSFFVDEEGDPTKAAMFGAIGGGALILAGSSAALAKGIYQKKKMGEWVSRKEVADFKNFEDNLSNAVNQNPTFKNSLSKNGKVVFPKEENELAKNWVKYLNQLGVKEGDDFALIESKAEFRRINSMNLNKIYSVLDADRTSGQLQDNWYKFFKDGKLRKTADNKALETAKNALTEAKKAKQSNLVNLENKVKEAQIAFDKAQEELKLFRKILALNKQDMTAEQVANHMASKRTTLLADLDKMPGKGTALIGVGIAGVVATLGAVGGAALAIKNNKDKLARLKARDAAATPAEAEGLGLTESDYNIQTLIFMNTLSDIEAKALALHGVN